ncbi:MAG: protein kinase [Candidatus Acidiferrum sp.]
MAATMIGQTLDHYRIIAQLGEGGMGVVYRARDEVLNRDVALKLLAPGVIDKVGRDHLLREAQTASSLSHPNICTIYQVGQTGKDFYVVMELIEGRSLSDLVSTTALSTETLMRHGVQIADALAHAHERGIVHRDVKSSNVMITPEGRVKVLDFGLATRLATEEVGELTLSQDTLESKLVGTLPYMAPEVLRGQKGDHLSDLWALGILLYEGAAAVQPFRGKTGFEISSAILREPPPPLPAAVPHGLAAVILRCLAKEPAGRYQRASEVRAALEALQGALLQSRQPHPSEETRGPRTLVLRGMEHLAVKNGDVLLMVGTNKGAFLLRSARDRTRWDVAGPYFHGQGINAMAYDARNGQHRLWVSTNNVMWGTFLRSSDDFGRTWTNPLEANIRFPTDSGASLKNIWQICAGRENEPKTLYCGVEPAALFESRDGGESWCLAHGLYDHPHRPRWMPSNGGLLLHTIVPDQHNPRLMYVAVSSGGFYRTEDGGATWQARNSGIRVVFTPEKFPEFGQCVHKIVLHESRPERLFLQNHWGIYRSDNRGDSWQDIAHGLPSDFGFAMVMHPHDPDCVYILPVESDEFRCTPDGHLRVYRTRNAGGSWEALTRGLPQMGAYETILRDAMSPDSLDPAGIYFGTRSGKLYASRDEGKSWKKILDGLPQILCVKAAVIHMEGAPTPNRYSNAKPSTKRKSVHAKKVKRGNRR